MTQRSVKRAVIVGGGIGGLCAAIALRRVGVEAFVYERAPEFGRVGAGLTVWANALKALRGLGLADAVIGAGSRIERAEVRTWRGRVLALSSPGELEARFGEPTVAVHRASLHSVLMGALPPGALIQGERFVGVEQDGEGVSVRFASGREERAGLLVAADGIHSAVRAQLFPESRPRYAGYTSWRGVVETADEAALGVTSESLGRGSRFGILRIDRGQVYWYATANAPAGQTRTARGEKEFLLERFRGWHHPVGALIESTPDEEILHTDIYDIEPMSRWSAGRVVLLGDSAHATTPNMGQGACMAIESAVVLARSLGEEASLEAALRRYESERMPRTRWITERSRSIGRVGQLENRVACAARDLLMRLAPESVVKRQIERAAGFVV